MKIRIHIYFALLSSLLIACDKNYLQENTSININIIGLELFEENLNNQNNNTTAHRSATSDPKLINLSSTTLEIPWGEGLGVSLTLSPTGQGSDYHSNVRNTTTEQRASTASETHPSVSKLENGIKYRLLIYDAEETKMIDTIFTVGQASNNISTLNGGETYTFVLYSIMSKENVPSAPSNKLSASLFDNISGDMDFIYFKKTITLESGRNDLNAVMKHQFSQITTNINATEIGQVQKVLARISDHYVNPKIAVSTGQVADYGTKAFNGKLLPFPLEPSSNATSNPVIICNNGSSASTLTLDEITINGITKRGISIPNIPLTPGVKYTLTLNVKTFTPDEDPGIELGNTIYAPGNLLYDWETDTYRFSGSGRGSYWFKDYIKARRTDLDSKGWGENNQRPRFELNGGSGDPCTKVSPENSWRLPNRSEMENIRTATEPQAKGHPGPNVYAPLRYVEENYEGTGRHGMFFGTQVKPNQAENYLFISFEGIYNDNSNPNDVNTTAWYMLKNGNAFESMQIGPNIYTFGFQPLDDNVALSIRCVKAD
ncbi:hypothetical protein ACFSQ3_05165 [Sphingobacterium corticis]|uniref:DUF4906 domain-containing protein n=1 Tax=Sphingobacterium corticis TaxID=1812823 RepID=A0ABW5NIR0_9SPHI